MNKWRETYNPLRGLTLARAVSMAESFQRGDMADLQWTYFFVEQTDPDLFALVERRASALLEMDWNVKLVSETRTGFDTMLANEQAAALRESYERLDNLYEAVEHLEMSAFRGFAHVEKHFDASGELTHLEILDQWNVVRDGLRGAWKYNPQARSTTFEGLPEDHVLDPARWIIAEPKRHINRIALFKFIRQNLSQKDWDAFIEIFGIPGWVIVMPPNVPADKQDDYEAAARAVAEGGSGTLPNGSTVHASDSPRGVNPFRAHLAFLQQQLVLAATGGLLTVLAQSGSGTLAGSAHMEAFKTIARARARRISEAFQRQHDKAFLEVRFPGCPILAYFELAANETVDTTQIIDHVARLTAAGFQLDPDEVSEKTGYKVTRIPSTASPRARKENR